MAMSFELGYVSLITQRTNGANVSERAFMSKDEFLSMYLIVDYIMYISMC